VGFVFCVKSNYLVSTLAESTVTAAESTDTTVESTATAVESVDFTSVDVPFPQEANATIANNATICFIIVCLIFVYL
jgi:hypothetical protein